MRKRGPDSESESALRGTPQPLPEQRYVSAERFGRALASQSEVVGVWLSTIDAFLHHS